MSTALVFREKEPTYYNKLMTEARDLYSAAVARKKAYSSPFIYDCAPPVRPLEGLSCVSLVLTSDLETQGQTCLAELILDIHKTQIAGTAHYDFNFRPRKPMTLNQDKDQMSA